MDIMEIMDILNIMIITAWMAMACAVSALVFMDKVVELISGGLDINGATLSSSDFVQLKLELGVCQIKDRRRNNECVILVKFL